MIFHASYFFVNAGAARSFESVRRGAGRCTRGRPFGYRSGQAVRSPIILLLAFLLGIVAPTRLHAAEVIPPKPDRYFNDYAGVVSKDAALRFNEQLAQFERDTSDQVVVAVFPKMQSDSSIEDYAQRVAQAWSVGQKDRRNGVVLLVFLADRKMSIQVGYGLEGALPDAIAYDIRENQIKPFFRSGNYEQGLATGIDLIAKAILGEYKGTGQTTNERKDSGNSVAGGLVFFIVFIIVLILIARVSRRRGYSYSSGGGPFIGGWSSGSGGGWSSGSGGGFSGFSGGGGSFGGGGSSGSW
jgi:uncharacterized protein